MKRHSLLRPEEELACQTTNIRNTASQGTLFKIKDLSLRYGEQLALNNINLDIQRGQITAIIGPSGCGKSSFLYCISRLIDQVPDAHISGSILFDDTDLFCPSLSNQSLRRRLAYIFQKPTPFPFSIKKNIALPLLEHQLVTKKNLDETVEMSLRSVGLWDEVKDRLQQSALHLSGGQQQRLCIARSLALNPDVLIMDEPCSALDPISSAVVEDLISELGRRYTVVMVTHNLAQAKRIAHSVGLFWLQGNAGTLVEFDHCEKLFYQAKHPLTRAYISGYKG